MTEEYEIIIEEDSLESYVESVKVLINNDLCEFVNINDSKIVFPPKPIFASLLNLSAEVCGGKLENILSAMVAVELINKSVQLFENDSTTAIFLLNSAYGTIFQTKNVSAERQILAHKEIVDCLNSNNLHEINTVTLIRLSMRIGAVLAGADYIQLTAITRFADMLEQADNQQLINRLSFIDRAKQIISDEFHVSPESHLLIDFATFYASNIEINKEELLLN